jgi:hypothetical protein
VFKLEFEFEFESSFYYTFIFKFRFGIEVVPPLPNRVPLTRVTGFFFPASFSKILHEGMEDLDKCAAYREELTDVTQMHTCHGCQGKIRCIRMSFTAALSSQRWTDTTRTKIRIHTYCVYL